MTKRKNRKGEWMRDNKQDGRITKSSATRSDQTRSDQTRPDQKVGPRKAVSCARNPYLAHAPKRDRIHILPAHSAFFHLKEECLIQKS